MSDLLRVLEGEANVGLQWLGENEMIANPEKFQSILIKKDRSDTNRSNATRKRGHVYNHEFSLGRRGQKLA